MRLLACVLGYAGIEIAREADITRLLVSMALVIAALTAARRAEAFAYLRREALKDSLHKEGGVRR